MVIRCFLHKFVFVFSFIDIGGDSVDVAGLETTNLRDELIRLRGTIEMDA